jgi:uncharacterized small protein (DUF1192 family)
MFDEDLEPRNKKPQPKDLSRLGVAELEEYIATLRAEISRAEGEIAARKKQRSGAESIFKR